jgi:uncharacterized membrane protein
LQWQKSGRGLPQSKTLREFSRFSLLRQLLDCGSLLPLSEESSMSSEREAKASWLPLSLAYSRGFPFFCSMGRMLDAVAKMDAHHRLFLAFVVAAVVGLALHTNALWTASLATYDAFAFAILALISVTVSLTPQERIRAVARQQDVGRTVIFLFVIIVACFALFAVAFLIRTGKPEDRHLSIHLLIALSTVVLSWLLMHAVFGLRYAHKFYDDDATNAEKHAGGLSFPEQNEPDYRDFAYFSYVIGMTCQVSDVAVTSREMRRLVLLHGILSFGFNTVILALTINTVSSFL